MCGRAADDTRPLVLEHANLIDGISAEPRHDMTVVVVGGKIESVSAGQGAVPASAQRFDLTGRWLLPGLIDAHIHPFNLKVAQGMLANDGMTTGRSMGVWHYVDVDLREQHRRGKADIPDILAAGYFILPNYKSSDGEITGLFEDHPQLADLNRDADIGVSGVERVVQANLSRQVDVIKLYVTKSVTSGDPYARLLSNDLIAAAVRVARNAGLPVAAHAYGDDGVVAAVNSGVTTIEHGLDLTDATLELMKNKGVWFTPTFSGRTRPDRIKSSRDTVRRAHEIGVRIIVGTDNGPRISSEIAAMAEVGMTPMEAIQAATSTCAEALQISNRTGSVQPGLEADLIVVNSNPLADLHELARVVLVINDGSVVVNRLTEKQSDLKEGSSGKP
jgi:imidazolonepropionase-like amidohydrolase